MSLQLIVVGKRHCRLLYVIAVLTGNEDTTVLCPYNIIFARDTALPSPLYDSGTYFNLRFAAKILSPAKVPKIVEGSGTASAGAVSKELLIAIASLAHSANKLAT